MTDPKAEITVEFEDEATYDLYAGWKPPKAEIVGGPLDGQELTFSPTEPKGPSDGG